MVHVRDFVVRSRRVRASKVALSSVIWLSVCLREKNSLDSASSVRTFFATGLRGDASTDVLDALDVRPRGVTWRPRFPETLPRSAGDPTCGDFAPARPTPSMAHPKSSATQHRKKMPRMRLGRFAILWSFLRVSFVNSSFVLA